jgi:hypothetical protein
MQQAFYTAIFLFELLPVVYGQSNSARPNQTARQHPTADRPSKQKSSQRRYLTVPLDLAQTNLGADFSGHNIAAVFEAVKNSPALSKKSEFESTASFELRRSSFSKRPLFANVTPKGELAFVIENSTLGSEFKYDADLATVVITLTGSTKRFLLEEDQPTLDAVPIRRVKTGRDSYVGSNVYGASAKVDRTYSDEFGVAFGTDSWLFRSSHDDGPVVGDGVDDIERRFSDLLAMGPEEAKALKPNATLLLVCRLTEPWYRAGAHGHDPTFSEPYETTVGERYLQIIPDQLWVFDKRTGEVVRKLSERPEPGGNPRTKHPELLHLR